MVLRALRVEKPRFLLDAVQQGGMIAREQMSENQDGYETAANHSEPDKSTTEAQRSQS